MFEEARSRLVETKAPAKDEALSFFIECLLYNEPDHLLKQRLAPTHVDILDWLETAKPKGFKFPNGRVQLFGPEPEQWTPDKARAISKALRGLWKPWV